MSDAVRRLFLEAGRHGLDVLLEKPGDRFRLAVQTSRASVRAGHGWYRAHCGMVEVKGSIVNQAADALATELERTPPEQGESRA